MRQRYRLLGLLISLITLAGIIIPYWFAWKMQGDGYVFGGFLFNPLDGNSYLAKMYQGYQGSWKFTLPYTAKPGESAYLFLFYLALGHLARFLGISMPLLFHIARILSAIFLLIVLWFYVESIDANGQGVIAIFAVLVLGSGMGWLALPFGGFTSDFWIAEAYPFLSMYANPHFPLGLALMVILLLFLRLKVSVWNSILAGLISVFMSVVNPFSVVVGMVAVTAVYIQKFYDNSNVWKKRALIFQEYVWRILPLLIGGMPVLLYDVFISRTHHALAIWNEQNITQTPAFWDLFLSFSPWFVFSVILFLLGLFRKKLNRHAVWVFLSLVLMYVPFSLQRRFMLGYYIPCVVAGFELLRLWIRKKSMYRMFVSLAILLSVPTNVILLAATYDGVMRHDPRIYLTKDEWQALMWLKENTLPDSLVVASPEMGLYIPAHAGSRVLYGHPFETVNADEMERELIRFFRGGLDVNEFLVQYKPDFLFWGPRERQINPSFIVDDAHLVFSNTTVQIFRFSEQ